MSLELPTASVSEVNRLPVHRSVSQILRLIALVTFFAFGAAVMPEKWMVEASEFLGFSPFPRSPLTFYLARHLSLLYGFVGVLFWIMASDVDHYRLLLKRLALLTIGFGAAQMVIDFQAGMPWWWTWGESLSTIAGGGLLKWLHGCLINEAQAAQLVTSETGNSR